jgi:hypothetical protein
LLKVRTTFWSFVGVLLSSVYCRVAMLPTAPIAVWPSPAELGGTVIAAVNA